MNNEFIEKLNKLLDKMSEKTHYNLYISDLTKRKYCIEKNEFIYNKNIIIKVNTDKGIESGTLYLS